MRALAGHASTGATDTVVSNTKQPSGRGARGTRASGRSLGAWFVGAALGVAMLGAPGEGFAQTKQELNKARAQFREGLALAAANNCAGALVKFKAVAEVKMTPQVAFNIAECEEKLGKLVSALGNYRLAESAAAGDPKAKDVAAQAGPRIAAIEGRIPKITITRGKNAEAASIEVDGIEIGEAQIGAPMPVDPGPHRVVGKVDGAEIWSETVTVAEKDEKPVEVIGKEVPKIEPTDRPPPPELPKEEPKPTSSGPSIPGIVLTSVGVVAIGAGLGVFFGPRQSKLDELYALCGGDNHCPPSAKPTEDEGRLLTGIAQGAVGVGAASLITGVILLAVGGGKAGGEKKAEASALSPSNVRFVGAAPGANLGGLGIVGRF